MKSVEIKELSTQELVERIEAEAAALNVMKINHSISPLENPQSIKVARRNIARMNGELRQRELTQSTK